MASTIDGIYKTTAPHPTPTPPRADADSPEQGVESWDEGPRALTNSDGSIVASESVAYSSGGRFSRQSTCESSGWKISRRGDVGR